MALARQQTDMVDRVPRARRGALGRLGAGLVAGAAFLPLAALVAMVVVLLVEALPAVHFNGAAFFTTGTWNIGSLYSNPTGAGGVLHLAGAHYGAVSLIVGTLECSAIALVIAFPIAYGSAVLITERLGRRLAAALGLCLEVLAGIPSVVFGLWGVLVLGPLLSNDVYPVLAKLPDLPVLDVFRGPVGSGEGLLSAGIVLSVMVIPIIAATSRDLLRQVPTAPKEGAEALGMTRRETFRAVQSRWVRSGVVGAAVLGLGRALGETIAVALVSGSQIHSPANIYDTMTTIAATIVNQLDSALTDPTRLAVRSLAEAALVLLVITLLVNIAARLLVRRSARDTALPVGAGL
ncbi:MAG TPA: phosphate ABC transporter permease subunit PstC [Acidimicrobiales bacterium]|nr:phosphate ABC transporter permease subunit PstC [Acidimicrobiales bacterium]